MQEIILHPLIRIILGFSSLQYPELIPDLLPNVLPDWIIQNSENNGCERSTFAIDKEIIIFLYSVLLLPSSKLIRLSKSPLYMHVSVQKYFCRILSITIKLKYHFFAISQCYIQVIANQV